MIKFAAGLGLVGALCLGTDAQAQQTLEVNPLVAGDTGVFTAGGLSGTAYVAYSTSGPGYNCPPPLGGLCLDINNPAPVATTTGVLSVPVPPLPGSTVWFQVAEPGMGVSNVVGAGVGSWSWEMGDQGSAFTGSDRFRGNEYTATSDENVMDFGMWLTPSTDCTLTAQVWKNGMLEWEMDVDALAGLHYNHAAPAGGYPVMAGETVILGFGWDSSCSVTYARSLTAQGGASMGGLTFNTWAYTDSWSAGSVPATSTILYPYHQTLVLE